MRSRHGCGRLRTGHGHPAPDRRWRRSRSQAPARWPQTATIDGHREPGGPHSIPSRKTFYGPALPSDGSISMFPHKFPYAGSNHAASDKFLFSLYHQTGGFESLSHRHHQNLDHATGIVGSSADPSVPRPPTRSDFRILRLRRRRLRRESRGAAVALPGRTRIGGSASAGWTAGDLTGRAGVSGSSCPAASSVYHPGNRLRAALAWNELLQAMCGSPRTQRCGKLCQRGARLARMRCSVRRCIDRRRAVSETLRSQSS